MNDNNANTANPIIDVFDFNRRCLQVTVKAVPQMELKHALFNVKAFREEATELEDQHLGPPAADGTRTEIVWSDPQSEEARWQTVRSVDAAIDNAYFAIGAMARAGLTEAQAILCFRAVHEANMTKKLGVVAGRGDMGVPDAAKPEGFVAPDRRIYDILFGADEVAEWGKDGEPINDNPLLKADVSETIVSQKG